MKKILLLTIVIFSVFLSINFSNALITEFNNSLSIENLTFVGDQNITRFLNLSANSTILPGTNLIIKSFISSASFPTNVYLEIGTPDGIFELNLTNELVPAYRNNLRYWDFDESSGVIFEDIANIGNANQTNGTIENVTKVFHSPGIIGNSANFSTRLNYGGVNISDESAYDDLFNGTEPFSISVWVNSGASSCSDANGDTILSKGFNTPNGFLQIQYDDDGTTCTPSLQIEDNAGGRFRIETTINHWEKDEWYHWVITYNGSANNISGTRIYINGTSVPLIVTDNAFSTINSNNQPVRLGVILNNVTIKNK